MRWRRHRSRPTNALAPEYIAEAAAAKLIEMQYGPVDHDLLAFVRTARSGAHKPTWRRAADAACYGGTGTHFICKSLNGDQIKKCI